MQHGRTRRGHGTAAQHDHVTQHGWCSTQDAPDATSPTPHSMATSGALSSLPHAVRASATCRGQGARACPEAWACSGKALAEGPPMQWASHKGAEGGRPQRRRQGWACASRTAFVEGQQVQLRVPHEGAHLPRQGAAQQQRPQWPALGDERACRPGDGGRCCGCCRGRCAAGPQRWRSPKPWQAGRWAGAGRGTAAGLLNRRRRPARRCVHVCTWARCASAQSPFARGLSSLHAPSHTACQRAARPCASSHGWRIGVRRPAESRARRGAGRAPAWRRGRAMGRRRGDGRHGTVFDVRF
jgi:hypothetical protein